MFSANLVTSRLKTIIHYDRILVLDKGELAEMGTPIELFEKRDGIFQGMCQRSNIHREDFDSPEFATALEHEKEG